MVWSWPLSTLQAEMSRVYVAVAGTLCVMVVAAFPQTTADQMSEQKSGLPYQEWNTTVLAVVSAAVLVSILVYAIVNCTDCYNSEVSTECHPAAASGGAKWGGAGGYSASETNDVNRSVLDAGFTADVVHPGERDSQPLPYALIPAQVPEAQGFRGYAPVEPAGAPAPGLRGYGAVGGGGAALAGYGGGGGGGGGGQWGGAGQGGRGSVPGYGAGGGGGQWGGAGQGVGGSVPGYGGGGGGGGSMAGYGAGGGGGGGGGQGQGGGQWGGAGYGREAGPWGGASPGGGQSQHLPGAHVSPVLTQEPQEPPPPYFAPSYR